MRSTVVASRSCHEWARIAALLAALAPATALAAEDPASSRVLSARDTIRIDSVGSPAVSPDGAWVLYTQASRDLSEEVTPDEGADDYERVTHVWRVGIDGTERRRMTAGPHDATAPRWLADSRRFAFLSPRPRTKKPARGDGDGDGDGGPKQQVHFQYLDGGEAWPVTDHAEGVSGFEISPDGGSIAFLAIDPLSAEKKRQKKEKDDSFVVDAEFRFTHLWVHDIESGNARRLTEGAFTVSDPQWSPGGRTLAYVTRPNPKNDDSWDSDVWVVDVASGATRKLHDNPGSDESPRFSPDGMTLAFASTPHVKTSTWYAKLHLVQVAGGATRVLLQDFDRGLGTPVWSPSGDRVYWSTGDRTDGALFSVALADGTVTRHATPSGANGSFDLSPDGTRLVWVHARPDWPDEIVTATVDEPTKQLRLSDANPWLREEGVRFGDAQPVRWRNSEGEEIEGVLTLPVGHRKGHRYPFILNPHGGPSAAVNTGFSATNQFFAGNGFAVLQPNFRGSSSYGQEFLNANRNQWGVRDYDDCMTGVDWAIAEGIADPERMIAYGWSYGGYMSFWISTQTDRFRLVSPGAGLSNLYSMYSTTDISNYLGWFFGTPWDNPEIYQRLSPIRHAKNVASRVLIMTGEKDERVPPEQSFEFYRALRDLGKDVELVIFPREGHGIREPYHAMDRLRRYLYAFAEAVGVEPVSEKSWEAAQAARREREERKDIEDDEDPNTPTAGS
ncbi:MAG TPA: S9 family peptidase [Thermoanaerobaculia bacterium]|nr:S9 family peptidase [Thermoanaerobaculia bacterium]